MQHYLRNVEPLNASLLERRLLQCELISRLCCTAIFHLRLSVASRLKDVSSHVQRGQTTIGEENIKKKLNAEKLGHDRSKLWRGTHRKQYPVTNSDTPTKTNASKKRSRVSQENLHSPAQHNTAPHSTHFIGVIAQTPRRARAQLWRGMRQPCRGSVLEPLYLEQAVARPLRFINFLHNLSTSLHKQDSVAVSSIRNQHVVTPKHLRQLEGRLTFEVGQP